LERYYLVLSRRRSGTLGSEVEVTEVLVELIVEEEAAFAEGDNANEEADASEEVNAETQENAEGNGTVGLEEEATGKSVKCRSSSLERFRKIMGCLGAIPSGQGERDCPQRMSSILRSW
jgi:pyruvate/2-oxoglutarate dehydrogenase complex dihydrolipoamide acyltransferase (E2) component